GSWYIKIVAGSMTNLTSTVFVSERNSSGTELSWTGVTVTLTSTLQQYSITRLLTNAATAFINTYVYFSFTSGSAFNITLRFGLPTLIGNGFVPVPAMYQTTNDTPRFMYNQVTGAPLGLLVEPQTTSLIRQSATFQGTSTDYGFDRCALAAPAILTPDGL